MDNLNEQYKSQHEYYEKRGFLSTFRKLASNADLDGVIDERVKLLEGKLYLPPRFFHGSELIEFGPDTGENALVFATLGASLTLVEPNPAAIPNIKQYFGDFGLLKNLRDLVNTDVFGFSTKRKFDVIDAEGFIYTVKPTEAWLAAFHQLLKPGGIFIITYLDRFGAVVEAAMKAAHTALRQLGGFESEIAAELLFGPKWRALSSSRPFSTWVKDILESPFIRQKYFLDAATLAREALNQGFELYSSWPSYRETTTAYWFKKPISAKERLRLDCEHIDRSRIGIMFGCRAYFTGSAEGLASVDRLTSEIVDNIDRLVAKTDRELATQVCEQFVELLHVVDSPVILTDQLDAGGLRPRRIAECLITLMRRISAGDLEGLVKFCQSDTTFIAEWGLPGHFAVYRKNAPPHTIELTFEIS